MQLTCRCIDGDLFTCDVTIEAASKGRIVGYAPFHGVCLLRADNCVILFVAIIKVANLDSAAEGDCALADAGIEIVEYLGILNKALELGNS